MTFCIYYFIYSFTKQTFVLYILISKVCDLLEIQFACLENETYKYFCDILFFIYSMIHNCMAILQELIQGINISKNVPINTRKVLKTLHKVKKNKKNRINLCSVSTFSLFICINFESFYVIDFTFFLCRNKTNIELIINRMEYNECYCLYMAV